MRQDGTGFIYTFLSLLDRLTLPTNPRLGAVQGIIGDDPVGGTHLPAGQTGVRLLDLDLLVEPLIEELLFGVEGVVFPREGNRQLALFGLVEPQEAG